LNRHSAGIDLHWPSNQGTMINGMGVMAQFALQKSAAHMSA